MTYLSLHRYPEARFCFGRPEMQQSRVWIHSTQPPKPMFTRVLFALGTGLWVWSAINPHDFGTWFIEQAATLVGIVIVLWLARSLSFDHLSRLALFALFCIHTIGTHYTYSLTPYDQLSLHIFGSTPSDWFGWERNHYDRFVHLAYGLLMTHPFEQAVQQRLQLRAGATKFISFNLILSTSALYELAEWWAAITFGGDVGTAYLGTQGDVWDAQADIALAGLGWLLAACTGILTTRLRRTKGMPL